MSAVTAAAARPGSLPRLPALTGLRFAAAAAVVAYHVGRYVEPLSGLRHVTGLGFTGVGFFFVLSGFVLAWSGRPGTPRSRFYLARFARVWPLHAVTTAVAAVPFLAWQGTESGPLTLAAVLLLVQAWWVFADVNFAYNGVSWSLSCEAFFYLVFPFFAYRAMRADRQQLLRAGLLVVAGLLAGALVVVLVLPPAGWGWALYVNPAYRLGEFVLGVLLACAVRGGWRPRTSLRTALVVLAGAYAVLLVAVGLLTDAQVRAVPAAVADLLMLPAFCLVIASAAGDGLRGRTTTFARPVWVLLGEWSFALYLVHELVLRVLLGVVSADPVAAAAQTVVAVGLAVGLAGALHHGVERPCERAVRRWAARRDARRSAAHLLTAPLSDPPAPAAPAVPAAVPGLVSSSSPTPSSPHARPDQPVPAAPVPAAPVRTQP
ncbi:acyltransferase family protein [Aquipuribacter hungaricus]|uniref:Acyltransferase family protein n=1 Tax=Aquipuribacter hungaricus TaxID=545624 RepID=A0ABV7WI10_9MICO